MGGRYLVTGVQLGLLKGLLEVIKDGRLELIPKADEEIEDILEHQFVFHRECVEGKTIQDDVIMFQDLIKREE